MYLFKWNMLYYFQNLHRMGRCETSRPSRELLRRVVPLQLGPWELGEVQATADQRPQKDRPRLGRAPVQPQLGWWWGLEGRHRGRTLSRSGQGGPRQSQEGENDSRNFVRKKGSDSHQVNFRFYSKFLKFDILTYKARTLKYNK